MSTPSHGPLGAMFAQLTGLIGYTIRTTPGLILITLGSGSGLAGHPIAGAAAVILGALLYRDHCGRTPYTDCARCHGTGHRPGRTRLLSRGRTAKRCAWCRGKGVRLRWGRAVMNAYRRATHTTRTDPAAPAPARPAAHAGPVSYADALRITTLTDRPHR
jgi:hypothetical protein